MDPSRWFPVVFLQLVLAISAEAGPSARQNAENPFLDIYPRIGDSLPDLQGYDETGQSFALRSFEGHYTVLTFGCLT